VFIMIRGLATRFGLGGLAVRYFHQPAGSLKQMWLEGGPLEQRRTARGHDDMRMAALRLPMLLTPKQAYPVPIRFLSGARFWHQTLFCIVSLQLRCDRRVDPIIFDDGTLSKEICDQMLRVVPWLRFILADEVAERLEARLPAVQYPFLRARRELYPHLRKLTDLHEADKWSLVFDSDMLFFHRPDALLEWMNQPNGIVFIEDVVRSYGYTDLLMNELSRGSVPDRMNVGLYGLHGSLVDYEYLERCCRVTIEREGANYVQEQALTALLVAGMTGTVLPRDAYIVLPSPREGRCPRAVMHHYVAHSKRAYFQYGWQRIVAELFEPVGKVVSHA
jgi:hypothetical protein